MSRKPPKQLNRKQTEENVKLARAIEELCRQLGVGEKRIGALPVNLSDGAIAGVLAYRMVKEVLRRAKFPMTPRRADRLLDQLIDLQTELKHLEYHVRPAIGQLEALITAVEKHLPDDEHPMPLEGKALAG